MTFLGLMRKSAWRKPLRMTLLVVSVTMAFFVYGLTASFLGSSQGASAARDDILGVTSLAGRIQPLPISYLNRLIGEPGVAAVSYVSRLRGYATVEKNIVPVSATDPQSLLDMRGKEFGLSADMVKALTGDRRKILLGRALAEARGWNVGQKVTVTTPNTAKQDGNHDWPFEIAGIFDGENASTDTFFVLAQYDYVNALRARDKDTVDVFVVRPQPDIPASELGPRIDQLFANSAAPTRTQSEKQFLELFCANMPMSG